MASRASAFLAALLPARASAFVAASVARASAFVGAAPASVPTDYTVSFAADCTSVDVRVARNWTGQTGLTFVARPLSGPELPALAVSLTTEAALIRFEPTADGVYTLLVTSSTGSLYRAPVLVWCRAAKCLRALTRALATSGPNQQAAAPSPEYQQVAARLICALAAHTTEDYATAQGLLDSLSPFCADCGCACPTC